MFGSAAPLWRAAAGILDSLEADEVTDEQEAGRIRAVAEALREIDGLAAPWIGVRSGAAVAGAPRQPDRDGDMPAPGSG